MKILLSFIFLISTLGQTFAFDKDLFKNLAIQNNIPTSSDGSCLKTRREVIKQLYNEAVEVTPPEGLKEHIDCLALLKNFKHDKKFQEYSPSWNDILFAKDQGSKRIEGKMNYMGFVPQKYSYDIKRNELNGYDISVNIYVKRWKLWRGSKLMNHSVSVRDKHQKRIFDKILEEVNSVWNSNEHNIRFKFQRVEDQNQANFSINVVQSLAPLKYNSKWTWFVTDNIHITDKQLTTDFDFTSSLKTYAHEVGHMLGLEDEYSLPKFPLGVVAGFVEKKLNSDKKYNELKTDKWVRGCDQTSIMCKDPGDKVFVNDYHYYLILRRYLK